MAWDTSARAIAYLNIAIAAYLLTIAGCVVFVVVKLRAQATRGGSIGQPPPRARAGARRVAIPPRQPMGFRNQPPAR